MDARLSSFIRSLTYSLIPNALIEWNGFGRTQVYRKIQTKANKDEQNTQNYKSDRDRVRKRKDQENNKRKKRKKYLRRENEKRFDKREIHWQWAANDIAALRCTLAGRTNKELKTNENK